MIFLVPFLIFYRTVYIWSMYHSFDERIQCLIFYFFSKRELGCSKFDFLEPCPTEALIKPLFSVCLSISSSPFLSGTGCYLFQIFCTIVDNWNIKKLTEHFFPEKILFP